MMKHLIIEGTDRTGKDTLIKNLLPYCQNAIITHFSTPEGSTDSDKRAFQHLSFSKEFEKASFLTNSLLFDEPKKDKMNILFWNRAHLGEFVYGKLYRETNPEEWVMKIEEEYNYDKAENVYLLLLTADPTFLASQDDGLSFDASAEARKKEIANFRAAFNLSDIKNKLEIEIDEQSDSQHRKYKSQEIITQQVLNFIKNVQQHK